MKMSNTRNGVMVINDIKELPLCFDWKRILNTNDYENQYGHMVELVEAENQ